MKNARRINTSRFVIEIIITIVVAYLFAVVLNVLLLLVVSFFTPINGDVPVITNIVYVSMGLLIGYKLSSLIRQYRLSR